MTWHDPERECHCRLDDAPADEAALDAEDRALLDKVRRFGWGVVNIPDVPRTAGWAFSVGMWHTLGSPELAVFGLEPRDAATAINTVGEHVQTSRFVGPDVIFDDVLADGRLVAFRRADDSWYQPLFGYALWFAQRPPLPIAQMVWADRNRRFPWEEGVEEACRLGQPGLWIPADEHPPSRWSGALATWPFPEPPTTPAFTTKRVAYEHRPVLWVIHEADGDWQFLDGQPTSAEDIAVAHLGHQVDTDPTLYVLADLPRGWEATRTTPGDPWVRRPVPDG